MSKHVICPSGCGAVKKKQKKKQVLVVAIATDINKENTELDCKFESEATFQWTAEL